MTGSAAEHRLRYRLFAAYAKLRLQLFLREILQLHQRFLVAFFYALALVLSAHEQLALKRNLAHLLTMVPWNRTDLFLIGCLLTYSLIAVALVRRSARGGPVHHFAESLPLPFLWERLVRVLVLSSINLTVLILFSLAWHELIHKGVALLQALLLAGACYIWLLGLQLSFLERNWRLLPFCCVGAFLLILSKGIDFVWLSLAASGPVAAWSFRREESPPHDHPELPLNRWRTCWRAALTRRIPAGLMMQVTYNLARPALLVHTGLLALGLNAILYMVIKESIPDSQKIHVYTCLTGFIGLFLSGFFRSFHLQRSEYRIWLNSLPRSDGWWLRQDTIFVCILFLLFTVPLSLALQSHLPLRVPSMVLPVHALSLLVLRHLQRSRNPDSSIPFVIGSCIWFLLVAYTCDHVLQEMTP